MSFEEKYDVFKRRQQAGTFTAKEIIKLLRTRELSTIHKVKVGDEEMTVAAFIETHESGGLPEQNLGKEEPEEKKGTKKRKKKETAPKAPKADATSSKASKASAKSAKSPPPTAVGKSTQARPKVTARQSAKMPSMKDGMGEKKGYATEEEPSDPMRKAVWSALLIGLFLIMAYVGSSLLNHVKLRGKIETTLQQSLRRDASEVELIGLSLEGFYLFDNPRDATVEVLKDGESRTYEFRVTGNGITESVQLELQ